MTTNVETTTNVEFFPVPTTKVAIPVDSRLYSLTSTCPTTFKGKQRQTIYNILKASKAPMSAKDMAKALKATGTYKVVDGRFEDSAKYHLHIMAKEGHVSTK